MTVPRPERLLIVTAVTAERDACAARLNAAESVLGPYPTLTATTPGGRIDIVAGGVGCASAGAATGSALASATYDRVLSIGIGGGFAPHEVGQLVVADTVIHADLGAEGPDGFIPADRLGLTDPVRWLDPTLIGQLVARIGAVAGSVLTVSTVTGSAVTAADLVRRYPTVAAEAMEGAGVLAAATAYGLPFGEIRAISNRVGPRDRTSWRIEDALAALTDAVAAIAAAPLGG